MGRWEIGVCVTVFVYFDDFCTMQMLLILTMWPKSQFVRLGVAFLMILPRIQYETSPLAIMLEAFNRGNFTGFGTTLISIRGNIDWKQSTFVGLAKAFIMCVFSIIDYYENQSANEACDCIAYTHQKHGSMIRNHARRNFVNIYMNRIDCLIKNAIFKLITRAVQCTGYIRLCYRWYDNTGEICLHWIFRTYSV